MNAERKVQFLEEDISGDRGDPLLQCCFSLFIPPYYISNKRQSEVVKRKDMKTFNGLRTILD